MRSPAVRIAVLAASVAIAGTSCAAPGPPLPHPPEAAPAVWTACGEATDCATVSVPVDYAEPEGETIGVALVRHRATDPAGRLGALLYNPGGPGAPASTAIRAIGRPGDPFGPDLAARYDIIGMDPRGVGGSEQVECLPEARREELLRVDRDVTLPGQLPLAALDRDARELGAGCAKNVDPALLPQLSTDNVARDMDQVRGALGEEKISYLGQSYGTLLGATYATLFPERVQHMVLDAPVDPVTWQQDPLGATEQQTVSAEEVVDAYFATCAAEGAVCPFGDGKPAEAFDALVRRLEAEPLQTPPTGNLPAGRVDGAALLDAARSAAFAPQLWPVLTTALVSAEKGDGALVTALGQLLLRDPDGSLNGLTESNVAVNCLDRVFPTSIGAYERNAEEIAKVAPRFGKQSGYIFLPCRDWPATNPDRFLDPLDGAGAPPILVIGSRTDSQTPYPWAVSMADRLNSGVLLTREGIGHGSVGIGNPCITAAVNGFFLGGVVPADGASCEQAPPTTQPLPQAG
ncbi:alpha/beta fold hydrolase [Pseudonocardia sp. 73-21]|uniref:alpha/beta hydrolase n=1 Tax=Pseudonocardia sp. 73-21 TaxID=1895809 RepID=UPI000B2A8262|nr:alpha/beta fold hydrolase [Pseudonocardia sp. 73-21]